MAVRHSRGCCVQHINSRLLHTLHESHTPVPIWISCKSRLLAVPCNSSCRSAGDNKRRPPCSSRDLILAPEAAGGLSPIILARTDAEERFNGHWSAYPLLGAQRRESSRGRGPWAWTGCSGSQIKSSNNLEQHDASYAPTLSALVALLRPGSILLSGQLPSFLR